MNGKGEHTYSEILSQPEAWAETLRAFAATRQGVLEAWGQVNPQEVIFIGCGSTHYLSQVAAAIFQRLTGVPARAWPSSELMFFPQQTMSDPGRTLLIAISRSGTTTETVEAVNLFRRRGGRAVWSVGCYPQSALVQASDIALLVEAAQEESVAQTRSFSSMLLLVQALAAAVAGEEGSVLDALPALGRRLLADCAPLAERLGGRPDLTRFFFLGSGPLYGVANEVMLKMKEMSLSHSEAYQFMEFRHGPMSIVNEQTLVIGLLSDRVRRHEERVMGEMADLGAHTLGVNANASSPCHEQISFGQSLPAWASPVLYLPALQLLAYYRAQSKGLDADNPQHLAAVISLDQRDFSEV